MTRNAVIAGLLSSILFGWIFFSDTFLKLAFSQKVWLHKANSIEELLSAQQEFSGVEVDVEYDLKRECFDIHHPPEPISGLSLQTYFNSISPKSDCNVWIDFKNLNDSNVKESLARLIQVLDSSQVQHDRVIVEAKNPCLLTSFSRSKFLTSYYLPSNISQLEQQERFKSLPRIRNEMKNCPTGYLSAEYKEYSLLAHHFPDAKKIFWFTAYGGWNKIKARLTLFELLLDDNVEVLLIKD